MHKVQRMVQLPTQCFVCLRGNTPDDPDTIDDFWAVDFERDFNWGDSTYICKYCVDQLALMCGFVTEGQLQEKDDIIEDQHKKIHDLKADLEAREMRLDQIAKGREALQQTKAERASQTPKKKVAT